MTPDYEVSGVRACDNLGLHSSHNWESLTDRWRCEGVTPVEAPTAAFLAVQRDVAREFGLAKQQHGDMTLDGPSITDAMRLAALGEEVGEAFAETTYDKGGDSYIKDLTGTAQKRSVKIWYDPSILGWYGQCVGRSAFVLDAMSRAELRAFGIIRVTRPERLYRELVQVSNVASTWASWLLKTGQVQQR